MQVQVKTFGTDTQAPTSFTLEAANRAQAFAYCRACGFAGRIKITEIYSDAGTDIDFPAVAQFLSVREYIAKRQRRGQEAMPVMTLEVKQYRRRHRGNKATQR